MTLLNKIILIVIIFSSIISAQDLSEQLKFADDLYEQRDFFNAITEYKRLLFFDEQKQYQFKANYKIGKSYFGGAKFDDAIKYFSLASINSNSDEEYFSSIIDIVRSNILRGTPENAISILHTNKNKFLSKNDELNYWLGWSYIFNDDWEKAASHFSKVNNNNISGSKFMTAFSDSIASEKYSQTKAKVMSFIVPGSGQIFAGEFINGIISFAWNAGLAYLAVNSFLEEREFDGILLSSLFLRFHRGNLQSAEKFIEEKNLKIKNEALIYLQQNYNGIKP